MLQIISSMVQLLADVAQHILAFLLPIRFILFFYILGVATAIVLGFAPGEKK